MAASVYLGARLAGEAPRGSLNLAVLTSLAAGSWLEHVTASGRPLREGDIA